MRKTKLIPREVSKQPITPGELRGWRKSMQWRQIDAADWLGASLRAYENWEQGVRPITGAVAKRRLMNLALREGKKGKPERIA